jgi:hypothetical protein
MRIDFAIRTERLARSDSNPTLAMEGVIVATLGARGCDSADCVARRKDRRSITSENGRRVWVSDGVGNGSSDSKKRDKEERDGREDDLHD